MGQRKPSAIIRDRHACSKPDVWQCGGRAAQDLGPRWRSERRCGTSFPREAAMTKPPIDFHQGFHDVDATGAGDAFEGYLVNVHAMPNWAESRRKRFELAAFREGERILDAGCGVGMDLAELSACVGKSGSIVGFDLSDDLIARARQRAAKLDTPISFQQGDLQALPFADATFDAGWSERVLMYLENPLAAVREILRILKPGGRFLAGEIDFGAIWSTSPDEAFRYALQQHTMKSVRNPGLSRQLPGLCVQAGFAKIKVQPTMGTSHDFSITERAANLVWHLDRMVEDGEVSRGAAEDYLETQRRLSRDGGFTSILVVPNLVATKRSAGA
ncbi:MAG: methyltransferase domain-containing protein [Proteobacteria bacterium]|nr:methyltransferase domain-containing protein [Pseudomonadota bacterium]